jgi:putative transposase
LHETLEALPKLPYRTTVHSDQGFQYQHWHWGKELKEHHVFQSMSRKATCLDNAAMESFFHILKCETVYLYDYQSFDEVAQAAADWIYYYNNYRIKQKLDGKSPVQYRLLTTEQIA